MKKTIVIYGFTLATMLFGPAVSGVNNTMARIDPKDVVTALEALEKLFCPEHPRKVCKDGYCMDGACISFRKHCVDNKDCQKDPTPTGPQQ